MLKWILYILIVLDGIVLSARNLAVYGLTLSDPDRRSLSLYNTAGILIFFIALIFLIVLFLRRPSASSKSHWPATPPE